MPVYQVESSRLRPRRVDVVGAPPVHVAVGKLKRRRHDADDRDTTGRPIRTVCPSTLRIGAERGAPVAVADQHGRRARRADARPSVKPRPSAGATPQHVEKAGRHRRSPDPLRQVAAWCRTTSSMIVAGDRRRTSSSGGSSPRGGRVRCRSRPDPSCVWISRTRRSAVGKGQRPQQHGVDGGEDGAVGADAERQRQHDGRP